MSNEKMKDEEYTQTQEQLKLIATLIMSIDLDGCLSRQGTADATAPLFHPTLYMAARDRYSIVKRLTKAAHTFQKEVMKLNKELEELGPSKHKPSDFGPGLFG